MAAQKKLTTSQLGSAAKENLPPKASKRTVSIGRLFEQGRHLRRKSDNSTRDVLAPKHAGISKSLAPKHGSVIPYHKPKKSRDHPLYLSFAEATKDYQQGAAAARSALLEPVYDALVSRVDGLDIRGHPLNTPGLPSKHDIDALEVQNLALTKSFDDERMTIQNHRKNGSVETKEVKLGDTMRAFQKLTESKRSELEGLLQQLQHVDAEMAAARREIAETESNEVKKAKKEFNAELDMLIDQADAIKEQTLSEVKRARQDDQAHKKDMARKIEDLVASF